MDNDYFELILGLVSEKLAPDWEPANVSSVRVTEKLGFLDYGPFEKRTQTAQMLNEAVSGRHYVLQSYRQLSGGHA